MSCLGIQGYPVLVNWTCSCFVKFILSTLHINNPSSEFTSRFKLQWFFFQSGHSLRLSELNIITCALWPKYNLKKVQLFHPSKFCFQRKNDHTSIDTAVPFTNNTLLLMNEHQTILSQFPCLFVSDQQFIHQS